MKAVLISIQPKWCELIAKGKKTVEVRKTKPKLETPFKVYIYCTKGETIYLPRDIFGNNALNGKVIGEFVCNRIDTYDDDTIHAFSREDYSKWNDFDLYNSCIHPEDFEYYANDNWLYGWHISDLVIYDKPKELNEFYKKCNDGCENCDFWKSVRVNADEYDMECSSDLYGHIPLKIPPQSWCYVKRLVTTNDNERYLPKGKLQICHLG